MGEGELPAIRRKLIPSPFPTVGSFGPDAVAQPELADAQLQPLELTSVPGGVESRKELEEHHSYPSELTPVFAEGIRSSTHVGVTGNASPTTESWPGSPASTTSNIGLLKDKTLLSNLPKRPEERGIDDDELE